LSRVIISSRQMTSEATDEPPGLSTRRMIAFTERSSRTSRICSTSESEPTMAPFKGSKRIRPEAIVPTA
jgi:hypothetical protein